ncbi:unnamed protein product, partial [Staurois parvus]
MRVKVRESLLVTRITRNNVPIGRYPLYPFSGDSPKFGICLTPTQGRTDISWGPQAIRDHGAPVSLPKLKKAYEKGTRGISWCPLLTPGPWAVPEFPNGQSAPGC